MTTNRPLWSSLARFVTALILTFTLLVGVGLAAIRAAYPLPALLYRTNDEIRLRELRCDSLFAPCVPADRALLKRLDSVDSMAQASPDGKLIAIRFAADWRLYPAACLLASAACPGQPMGVPAETMRLAWGPQSQTLVYLLGGGDTMRILTRGCLPGQTGTCTRTEVETGLNGVHTPTWSADGTLLALSGPPKGLLLLDVACLRKPDTCLLTPYRAYDPVQYWWATLSHDGKRVLYQEDGPMSESIVIRDLPSGQRRVLTPQFRSLASTPAWDTSERFLAYILSDFETAKMMVYDLDRDKEVRLTRAPGVFAFFPEWLSAR